jgi:hypothetical protein
LTCDVESKRAVHFFGRYMKEAPKSLIHEIGSKKPGGVIERI